MEPGAPNILWIVVVGGMCTLPLMAFTMGGVGPTAGYGTCSDTGNQIRTHEQRVHNTRAPLALIYAFSLQQPPWRDWARGL